MIRLSTYLKQYKYVSWAHRGAIAISGLTIWVLGSEMSSISRSTVPFRRGKHNFKHGPGEVEMERVGWVSGHLTISRVAFIVAWDQKTDL
jgi:hypothetical protein